MGDTPETHEPFLTWDVEGRSNVCVCVLVLKV